MWLTWFSNLDSPFLKNKNNSFLKLFSRSFFLLSLEEQPIFQPEQITKVVQY